MKISEIVVEGKDPRALLQMISNGEAPRIENASYVSGAFAWGDLERLGLATRDQRRIQGPLVEQWWVYSRKAPGPITLVTCCPERSVVMQPGDKTEPMEVDYS